jgi:hypothetical protein
MLQTWVQGHSGCTEPDKNAEKAGLSSGALKMDREANKTRTHRIIICR